MAGLGGVQPYLAEAGVGELAGEVLGVVTGQAVGGVPTRSRPGQALGEHRAAASAPEGLAAYHARIRALAAGVPAAHREAVAAFLAAAAAAAAGEISR